MMTSAWQTVKKRGVVSRKAYEKETKKKNIVRWW